MDIVISMNKKDFNHKMQKDMYGCYWSMGRVPVNFFPECDCDPDCASPEDVVFVLTDHQIVGYITPREFNPEDINGYTIVWDGLHDFTYIKPIPFKPFRGFRYRWFDYELRDKKK